MSGRIVCLGECMVELAPAGEGLYRRGFAGDTFNMAWYLRRRLPGAWRVDYGTCLGTDAVSDEMAAFMGASGVGTEAIRRIGDRTVGLYLIDVRDGERSFTYWRGQSAAKALAADEDWLAGAVAGADLVVLSGITVAVVPEEERPALIRVLSAAREAGSRVAFDPNLRPRLWPGAEAMRAAIEAAASVADIVLPSFDDERTWFGDADKAATVARYRGLGAATVVVKDGPGRVEAWDAAEGAAAFEPEPVRVVDSTAAGDSFNAGLLAARLQGAALGEALGEGARLAGRVCGASGALVETGAD